MRKIRGSRDVPLHLEKKIRLVDAAHAAQTSVNTVKNWIARGQVQLFSDEPEDGWREFDLLDVQLLALVRVLIDHGVPPSSASSLARAMVTLGIPDPAPEDMTPAPALTAWVGKLALVWRVDDNQWRSGTVGAGKSFSEFRAAGIRSAVIVDVRAVITAALERL